MLGFLSIVFGLPFFLNKMIDFPNTRSHVGRLFPLSLMSLGLAQTLNFSDLTHVSCREKKKL